MPAMTLVELIERYTTLRNLDEKTVSLYGGLRDRLERFLGRPATVADLDDLTIARYLRWRADTPGWRNQKPSPASVQKDRTMIVAIWNLAARKRWAKEFPELPRIKVPKRLPTGRAYTVEDVRTLILRAKNRKGRTGGHPSAWWWQTLLYTAFCTGERHHALTSLRWGQVDLAHRRVVFLGENRKGKTRDIERDITDELAEMLAARQGPPEALVWPWDRKSKSQWTSLKLLCELADVKYRGFHGFRRSAASYAALAGGRAAATQLLDHADPNLQQVYVDTDICPEARPVLPSLDLTRPAPHDEQDPPADRPAA
jgi:integrase